MTSELDSLRVKHHKLGLKYNELVLKEAEFNDVIAKKML